MKNRKKLKILMVTDRLSVGGAETHILSLCRELSALGHYVTVASSGGSLSGSVRHEAIELASHSPIRLVRGYFALRSLALREGFDVIHAHARLPALIASLVARELKIPLVTTVHARFKIDRLRRIFSVWGFRSIAVSEDLRAYLTRSYSIPAENITVIENGVEFKGKRVGGFEKSGRTILFLSRLDADCSLCAKLLCDIAPRLCARYGDIKICIGGGGESFEKIKKSASEVNARAGCEVICVLGEVRDVSEFLASGDAFVGVSRCALEAVASSLPVIIAGNEGFLGRLTPSNFSLALSSNFCARGGALPDAETLFCEVCSLIDGFPLAQSDACEVYTQARSRLEISLIAPRYERFYFKAIDDFSRSRIRVAGTLLFGYYGFSNLGDDALLRSSIDRALHEFGGSVGAFTHSPRRTSRQFAIPCYSRFMPLTLAFRLFCCDRLIFGGGTLFQDRTSGRSLMLYIFVLRLAQILKKDTLLYANGIGEIQNARLRASLFSALARCSYIGVRDKRSYEILRSALSCSAPIVLENDLALALKPSSPSRAEYLLYSALGKRRNRFFVVCPYCYASRFERFELEMAIRKQKSLGLAPLFILCSPDDFEIAYSLRGKFGGGMIYDASFSDLLMILQNSEYLISMRYHPLLAARICKTPFLPLGDDPKIAEFIEK